MVARLFCVDDDSFWRIFGELQDQILRPTHARARLRTRLKRTVRLIRLQIQR